MRSRVVVRPLRSKIKFWPKPLFAVNSRRISNHCSPNAARLGAIYKTLAYAKIKLPGDFKNSLEGDGRILDVVYEILIDGGIKEGHYLAYHHSQKNKPRTPISQETFDEFVSAVSETEGGSNNLSYYKLQAFLQKRQYGYQPTDLVKYIKAGRRNNYRSIAFFDDNFVNIDSQRYLLKKANLTLKKELGDEFKLPDKFVEALMKAGKMALFCNICTLFSGLTNNPYSQAGNTIHIKQSHIQKIIEGVYDEGNDCIKADDLERIKNNICMKRLTPLPRTQKDFDNMLELLCQQNYCAKGTFKLF